MNSDNLKIILDKLNNIELKMNQIEQKLDILNDKIDSDLTNNCQKMSDHIDFIERVYDNVKNPLGFICNKLNFYATDNYDLENKNQNQNQNKLDNA